MVAIHDARCLFLVGGVIECGLKSGLCVRQFSKPRDRYGDQRIGSQSKLRTPWLYVSN